MKEKMKMDGNNVILEEEKGNVAISFLKMFYVPVAIVLFSLILCVSLLPIEKNLEKHFITPYDTSVTYQDSDLYVVALYHPNQALSVKFLQCLKQAEKDYGLDYYLIDVEQYPSVLSAWQITYWPTYFVFERTGSSKAAKLLYKSFGDKEAVALNKEITNVKTYGLPINQVGVSNKVKNEDGKDLFEITLTKITPNSSSDSKFTAEFSVKNLKDSKQTFNPKEMHAFSNPWKEGASIVEFTNQTSEETIIDADSTKKISIEFDGSTIYNQITLKYGTSDSYQWQYKMWPN